MARKWKVRYTIEVEEEIEFDTNKPLLAAKKAYSDPEVVLKRKRRVMESGPLSELRFRPIGDNPDGGGTLAETAEIA